MNLHFDINNWLEILWQDKFVLYLLPINVIDVMSEEAEDDVDDGAAADDDDDDEMDDWTQVQARTRWV